MLAEDKTSCLRILKRRLRNQSNRSSHYVLVEAIFMLGFVKRQRQVSS